MVLQVLLAGLGFVLLITGTLPIGRFPSFASDVALLRPPYGRILGAAIILFVIYLWVLKLHVSSLTVVILSIVLLLIALICIIFSLNERVR